MALATIIVMLGKPFVFLLYPFNLFLHTNTTTIAALDNSAENLL